MQGPRKPFKLMCVLGGWYTFHLPASTSWFRFLFAEHTNVGGQKRHKPKRNERNKPNHKVKGLSFQSIFVDCCTRRRHENVAPYINTWCSTVPTYKPKHTEPKPQNQTEHKGIYYLYVCILTKQKSNCCFWLFAICACTWLFAADNVNNSFFFRISHFLRFIYKWAK